MTHDPPVSIQDRSADDALAAAREYIASHSLGAANISSGDLRLLLRGLSLPVETVAQLLGCAIEAIEKRANQWRISHISNKTGGRARENRSKRQETKYSKEMRQAVLFIEQRDLLAREPTIDDYEYLYQTLGLPIGLLGRLLKRSQSIRAEIVKAGIGLRSRYEQKLARYKSDFFKSWTPEMAWVLGLLYTDGNVGKYVTIESIDVDLLQQVGALLMRKFKIFERLQSDGRNRISRLIIHHPGIISDLRTLGLTERKSLTMEFPMVPAEYVRHFIRGCWDGDGGFTISGGKLTAHYTCGSLAFIQKIADELYKAGVSRRILVPSKRYSAIDNEHLRKEYGAHGPFPLSIYKRKNANAYDLRLGGRHQLVPLINYFYKDVGQHMYLKRKYDLISQYL